ncbi:MAG: hypothetical protein EHM45_06360 [Desulfobacteraceae bacterium]|nr:MAG: hypothetical protein EHM45_06360 [Desulfobacteraceae bacterium]
MLKLHLIIKKRSEAMLCLTLANGFRYFFFGLALFLAVFLLMDRPAHTESVSLAPLLIISILILSGCYHEEWRFDLMRKNVESRFGLLFFYQRKIISFEDIETFRITEFTKGHQGMVEADKKRFFQVSYSKFSLVTKQGLVKDIEIMKSKYGNDLQKKAETVAEFCKKALIPNGSKP